MKTIKFQKFQGTGNDFVITEDLQAPSKAIIQQICDRKYGIGADGLICMKAGGNGVDFQMMYYNADGSESFCGNGSRCSVRYAFNRSWIGEQCAFSSNDGIHQAQIDEDWVQLKMHDLNQIYQRGADYQLNTGSPHYITYVDELDQLEIVEPAQNIRYSEEFKDQGINVNFLCEVEHALHVRTYERGVEDETLSCGTGVTAAALAHHQKNGLPNGSHKQAIMTKGGELEILFTYQDGQYTNIYLNGPAEFVFEGEIQLSL